jgi:protein subunit release factor A
MKASDLKIEAVDSRPPGGQQVGVMPKTVKVTHIPTGISATCGSERSQLVNRDVAISMVEWGLEVICWKEMP